MNLAAVCHTPMSQDAYGVDEKHIFIRLRAGRNDLVSCTLFYGDRASRQNPVPMTTVPMRRAARDEWFDYYEVLFQCPYVRVCYSFYLDDGKEQCYYHADFPSQALPEDRSEYYQLPFNHRADRIHVPEWAKDAVVYHIFPDSFASGHRFLSGQAVKTEFNGFPCKGKLGGTLHGIRANVDYLCDLGINCIYMNPIFAAGEYHKYDTLDYFHVDPCLGTDAEFRALVKEYHEKGIRVIIDGVFNHAGWHFFAFEDVVKNGEASPYKDWFYEITFPVKVPAVWEEIPSYACFGYERHMPKLNTENPEVIRYLCNVCQHWLMEYNMDGWRLDVADEVNDGFWRAFKSAARAAKPDSLLIGEIWESAQHWLDGSQFDSTMNYDFRKHCAGFFGKGTLDAAAFDFRVTHMRMRYCLPMLYSQLNLLDSHDVSRFLSLCEDKKAYRLAVLFQMTFPGMPSVFYGDEKGISGVKEAEYRQAMDWSDKPGVLRDFYRQAIRLRHQEPALRRGAFETVMADRGSGLYVYKRSLPEESITIALNNQHRQAAYAIKNSEQVLWQEGYRDGCLAEYGFVMIKGAGDKEAVAWR